MKLIPTETGIINVKSPVDSALKSNNAETKISTKAPITCISINNLIQSLKEDSSLPFSFHLMITAPETFNKA